MRRALIFAAPAILIIFAGAAFFFGEEIAQFVSRFSPGCASRRFLGIACPGCGGTRAFCALMRGDFSTAILANPWWIPTAGILLCEWLFWAFPRKFNTPRGEKIHIFLVKIYAAGTLVFWVLRNVFDF